VHRADRRLAVSQVTFLAACSSCSVARVAIARSRFIVMVVLHAAAGWAATADAVPWRAVSQEGSCREE
jgi:hypothetical protein